MRHFGRFGSTTTANTAVDSPLKLKSKASLVQPQPLLVTIKTMMIVLTTVSSLSSRMAITTTKSSAFVRSFTPTLVSKRQSHRMATTLFSTSTDNSDNVWTTDRVRSTFVEFFQEREHTLQPSSACAPLNDPTLLFTNAGMNQFKPIFLGQVDPNSPLALLNRAVNSQKCIRAGGKHNDLEDVGRDTYHHTFFEMLGTWSFGDYFKKEAIDYAWTLLTEVYKLNPDRLYATYFEGDDQVEIDTEARDFWLQYLPPERVIGCSAADNFWEVRACWKEI
jgi:tRNA synthetases class II (A)